MYHTRFLFMATKRDRSKKQTQYQSFERNYLARSIMAPEAWGSGRRSSPAAAVNDPKNGNLMRSITHSIPDIYLMLCGIYSYNVMARAIAGGPNRPRRMKTKTNYLSVRLIVNYPDQRLARGYPRLERTILGTMALIANTAPQFKGGIAQGGNTSLNFVTVSLMHSEKHQASPAGFASFNWGIHVYSPCPLMSPSARRIRLRSPTRPRPVIFVSGTDAEVLAESLIRDFAWQNPPDSNGENDHHDHTSDDIFGINSATGGEGGVGGGGGGAERGGEAGVPHLLAAANELQTNNALDAAGPLVAGVDGNSKTLGMRRGSTESIGSADSFSVPRDGCWVGFEPAFGDIAPGRSATITVRANKPAYWYR